MPEELEQERDHFRNEMRRYMRRCEVLEANLKAFTVALEWYANPANWQEQVDDRGRETMRWRWADDDGRMAQHALDCWRENNHVRQNQKDARPALQEGTRETTESVRADGNERERGDTPAH